MPKQFLNVEYSGTKTEVDITTAERLGEVQDAIKAKYGEDIPAPASRIELYDKQRNLITNLDDIPEKYYMKSKNGGLFLVVRTTPPPSRQQPSFVTDQLSLSTTNGGPSLRPGLLLTAISSQPKNDENPLFTRVIDQLSSTTFLSAEENLSRKRHRMDISYITTGLLKSFASRQLVEGCIQSQDQAFLPYPQEEIKKLYVRKCYEDVFQLLLERIESGKKSFAISGTPGIGKSLFFVYILYRLMDDFHMKTLSLKPNRVVYQMGQMYRCFDLQQQLVTIATKSDAERLVEEQDTFYVIDGQTSEPLAPFCVVLFISSPHSERYKRFVKQKKAKQWFFPVWTLAELQTCQRHCYPQLPIEMLRERHRIYGGVARFVFHDDYSIPVPTTMRCALSHINAARGVKYVGELNNIFPTSHTLLQIMVGNDEFGNAYQFTDLDVASKYVGEQLWIRYAAQMLTNLQEMFADSPSEISRHLFEIYGHREFSAGGRTLKCRCLESDTVTEMKLDALHSQRITFGKDTLPTAEDLLGNYYEPTDDDNFPAIDSLSSQGMFQFTVAAEHPIRGVYILQTLCKLYDEPKLYFVVPPHRFSAFKKQSFKVKDVGLKQYVLELPVV